MKLPSILITVLCLFLFIADTMAMEIEILNYPDKLEADEPFDIDVKISNATGNASWLRAVFVAQDFDRGYFGYILSNDGETWGNSASDTDSLFHIDTSEDKDWEGKLTIKADIDHRYYTGPGKYTFRLGRYTQGGSNTAWSNEVEIEIKYQPPPSPTPTPRPSPTPRSTPTPVSKTPTPAPESGTNTTTEDQLLPASSPRSSNQVLGAETEAEEASSSLVLPTISLPQEYPDDSDDNNEKTNRTTESETNSKQGFFFISGGLAFISGGVVRLFKG